MKILVSCMGYDGGKSGISAYMRNVVEGLKSHFNNDITLLVEPDSVEDFKGFKQIVVPKFFSKSAKGFLWHMFMSPFNARKYDCFLILAANRRFCAWGKTPTVGVVHDLSQYRVAAKYDRLRMFYLEKLQPYFGRRLTQIAAISMSTLDDVVKYWRVDKSKVSLNYNGYTPLSEADDSILKRLNLGRYIFYVSRIEHPGKNHMGLIQAFEKLDESNFADCKLVFTGSDWNGADVVREYAKKSPKKEKIIFTGFVTNQELASLYRNASAFVFPSFSEGFGLGLIEAMGAGVACACSNDSALGEVGADAAIKFNPNSVEEIKDSIEKILGNQEVARKLIEKGYLRAKDFDWRKHSDKLIELSKKATQENSRLKIFSIEFVNARMSDIVDELIENIKTKKRKSIAFINTHYLNSAYSDARQIQSLKWFDYVLPDGSGVSLACKILGYAYRDNLNGTDLLPQLCAKAEKENLTLYFFGGKENVAKKAVENLKKMFPSLNVVGTRSGYYKPEELDSIIAEINSKNPDMLFIGFGVKLQEQWVEKNFANLNARAVFAIGGVCDVYSGNLNRNPILRRFGLEWLGRFYQEPIRLFNRYAIGNPLFVLRVIKYKLFGKNS